MRTFQVVILLSISQLVFGQSAKVLVQNAKSSKPSDPLIEVKWYSSAFVYPKGCNIYRKLRGESSWSKLNTSPILLSKSVPAAIARQDGDMDAMLSMANEMNKNKGNGFLLLNLYAKSFQSAQFAKLAGIQYDDNKVVFGSSYEYRITTIGKNEETELAVSLPIKSSVYVPDKPVQEFTAKGEKNRAKLKWKPDEGAFYGINVYRNTNEDSVWKKMNKQPIVISESTGNPPASDAFYIDNNLSENSTFYYRIVGLDFFGGESQPTAKIQIQVGDITPPPAPENIKSKVVNNLNVRISWLVALSDDVAGYYLYRSSKSDGPFNKVNEVLFPRADSVHEDSVPSAGFYYYYVASADKAGNEKPSEKTLIEVKDIIPPAVPRNVAARPDTGRIILSWASNHEPDLIGYYVYRAIRTDGGGSFVLVNAKPLKDSTYVQVFPGNASNSFLFKIVAVDSSYNKSAPSEAVSARMPDVTPPVKPIIKNMALKGDSVLMTWVTNPESDIQGYNLYRYKAKALEKTKVNTQIIPASSNAFADTARLESGKIYYQLQAVDESGNGSAFSDAFPVEILAKFDYRFVHVTAKFSKRKKATTITWSGVKPDKNLLGFVVFRQGGTDMAWKSLAGLQSANVFEDKSIQGKTKYLYKVRAYSSVGKTIWSDVIEIK